MAITSFYLLNMFPRMRTLSSSPNNQHPTPRPNMFLQMRTLHHHRTINTQHPSQTCSFRCALYIIIEQSTPITQAKHVPSDAHFIIITQQSTPNTQAKTCSLRCALYIITQQSTTNTQAKTCSLGCALHHHHPTINTHHPTAMSVIQ